MENEKRVHRVGSITSGLTMVGFGILFIIKNITDAISYTTICRLWPAILILLGAEILAYNVKDRKFVYDKGAVFLLIVLMFFAMGMAGADMCIAYAEHNLL